jgi:hypothetical protein
VFLTDIASQISFAFHSFEEAIVRRANVRNRSSVTSCSDSGVVSYRDHQEVPGWNAPFTSARVRRARSVSALWPSTTAVSIGSSAGSTSSNGGGLPHSKPYVLGYGGFNEVAAITGLHPETVRRGRDELAGDLKGRPADRVRLPGGGGQSLAKKTRPSSRT